jgi:hypothetical protein
LISPSDPHFFPFFFGNNRVRCKPRRFTGGPFPVRPIRVYAFHSLANPAILFERGVIPGQAAQGLLPVPEGHAPDGQFQAPGFHDCPRLNESVMTGNIPANPVGYPANG